MAIQEIIKAGIDAAVTTIKAVTRQTGAGPNKDFDKWLQSSLLVFCAEQAQKTGIPVAVCWWDSILQINPDGTWFKHADVAGCAVGANEVQLTQLQARVGEYWLAKGAPGSDLTGSDLKTTNRALVTYELRGGSFLSSLGDLIPSFGSTGGVPTQDGMSRNNLIGLGVGLAVIAGAIFFLK